MNESSADEIVSHGPSTVHGNGVFATRQIISGEFIGRYSGLPTAVDGTYVLWVEHDDGDYRGIDGDTVLKWLNHSGAPNVEFDGPDLHAIQNIEIGEELFFHYGEEWNHVA